MNEFKFSCPGCGQHILATDAYRGHQINCPSCQNSITVPQLVQPSPQPPANAPYRATPARKSSKTLWIILGSTATLLILGGLAVVLMFGVHQRSPESPALAQIDAAVSRANSKRSTATDARTPSAAEILDKVTAQYASLASYSASGTAVSDMDMSKVDVTKLPGMDSAPKDVKNSKQIEKMMSQPIKLEVGFTMKLARPDLYRIEWEGKAGPQGMNGMKGAAWSAGDGDFLMLTKAKYTRVEGRDQALAMATGVSGGAAGTMPLIFFGGAASPLGAFKNSVRAEDDSLDGTDCYVLNGDAMGMKMILWVAKDTFLIRQKQMVFGGNATMPKASDAQMDEQLNKMGNLTPEQIKQAKAAAKNMQPMLSKMRGTMTETYSNLETNTPLAKEDFNFTPPAEASLSKTLF